jgi:putative aminopeptidase
MTARSSLLAHLEALLAVPGAPGHEDAVATAIRGRLRPDRRSSSRIDAHGNLTIEMAGAVPGPTLLLAAHMDQIALIVRGIEADGFLRVSALGSIVVDLTLGRIVRVGERWGVVGTRPGHYFAARERGGIDEFAARDVYVDVGASSAAAVRAAGIDVGTPVVLHAPPLAFGVDAERIVAGGLDDRLGCALLLTLLESVEVDVGRLIVAFTVQEEVGLRGAGAVAAAFAPDFALAVDTIACSDTPEGDGVAALPLRLGGGPALALATGPRGTGLITRPKAAAWLRAAARSAGVAVQEFVATGGDNDSTTMAWADAGRLAGSISIPRRYAHSPVEVADLRDVEAAFAWLQGVVAALPDLPKGDG